MAKTYTIESSAIGVSGGRYKSDSPSGAAKKAASILFRKASKSQKYKSVKKIKLCIRETTSGSEKKTFEYFATRVKLAKPVVRELNGVQIVNKYKVSVKAIGAKQAKTTKKTAKKGGDCGCNK